MSRFARIRALVLEALERPAGERSRFLDEACAGDPALREEVASLLAQEDPAKAIDAPGGLADRVGAFRAAPRAEIPERVGPYRIVGVLGEGGMGVVYRAMQSEPLRREVALKVIRIGLQTERVAARFAAERRTLALMDHPGIARVLDAGTDEGRPFVVMELVDGSPITEFADRRRLPLSDRLALFRQVGEAVQHAHQKGVIHRDLKPSNLLVREADGRPVAKVIDFGIAKVLEESAAETTLLTREGQIVGTPQYMSPEQAALLPQAVDVRTDVYALGVVLYELLAGIRPFDGGPGEPSDFAHLRNALVDRDPPGPDTRLPALGAGLPEAAAARASTPAALTRVLRGDLGRIVRKALARDSALRYPAVSELIADLRRHEAGLPVEAAGPGTVYRLRLFVRRHRVPVTAAVLGLLALLAGAAGTAWQAVRATREQRRAETRLANVQRFAESLLFGVHDRVADLPGSTPVREYIVKTAVDYLDEMARDPEEAALLGASLASAYAQLGKVQRDLGQTAAARVSQEKALALARTLAAGNRNDLPAQLGLARRLNGVAMVTATEGDLEGAAGFHEEARGIYAALTSAQPESVSVRRELADTESRIAFIAVRTGRAPEAVEHARAAVRIQEVLYATTGDREDLNALSRAYGFLGESLAETGDHEAALTSYRRAALLTEEYWGAHPETPRGQQFLGIVLGALAGEEMELDRFIEAERDAARSLDLRRARAALQPENRRAVHDLARGFELLGDILVEAARWDDANANYLEARTRFERVATEDPENTFARRDLVGIHLDLATVALARGRPDEALRLVEAVRRENQELLAADPEASIHHEQAARGAHIAGLAHARRAHAPGLAAGERRDRWEDARRWFARTAAAIDTFRAAGLSTPVVEESLPDPGPGLASCDSALAALH